MTRQGPGAPPLRPGARGGTAVLIALSLAISGGTLDPYALALVTVSGGAVFVAARSGLQANRPPPRGPRGHSLFRHRGEPRP